MFGEELVFFFQNGAGCSEDTPGITPARRFQVGMDLASTGLMSNCLRATLSLRALKRVPRRVLAEQLRGGPPSDAEWSLAWRALSDRERHRIDRQLQIVRLMGIRWVPPWRWSERMLAVQGAATGLFVRGEPEVLGRTSVAIVGARRSCSSAECWAAQVASDAATRGLQVVSGGARGIDAVAHRSALASKGQTVAFVGVGADSVYPAQNRRLFAEIIEHGGAVVTEHPPGEGGYPGDHAARNRFIAALGIATFLAEARARSGTLGTARVALRLGRPVWVSAPGVGELRAGLDEALTRGAQVWTEESRKTFWVDAETYKVYRAPASSIESSAFADQESQ